MGWPLNQMLRSTLSRRLFLRSLAALALQGAVAAATACQKPLFPNSQPSQPVAMPETTRTTVATATAATTPTLGPTATVAPTLTAAPSATPVPSPSEIPEGEVLAEGSLAQVIVAYDPAVTGYPSAAPFDPSATYPEYPFGPEDFASGNGAYALLRQALRLLTPEGFGTAQWNPLRQLIQPGDMVLVKPNLVDEPDWDRGKITHPAVLRAVIDYAYLACRPSGRIVLAEGPWAGGVLDHLAEVTGIRAMVQHLAERRGVPLSLVDLNESPLASTPLVDLGSASELLQVDRVWYDGHRRPLHSGGDPGIGSYRIAPEVLEADVVISVPKAKVHPSGGVTLTMKNMLGIIPSWDGPYSQAAMKDCAHTSDLDLSKGLRGEYLENDTIWRSMSDLNRIVLYADRQGRLQPQRQRRYLAIVDAIIAGEENLYTPRPYPLSTIVIGFDPVTVDAVTARTMGFDHRLIKSVMQAASGTQFPLGTANPARIRVVLSGDGDLSTIYRHALIPEMKVYPWEGHIEASDFEPLSIAAPSWDSGSGDLQVTVRDTSGVACVRVAYVYSGERRMKDLALVKGSQTEGEWRVPFPVGRVVRNVTLIATDELFNSTSSDLSL